MSSLFRFPPNSALHVEGSTRTYFWRREKTDCLPALCGLHTYPAMSVTEDFDGYYTVQGTSTALTECGDSTNGDAKYGRRSLRDLLHLYRDLRHQATLRTLVEHNPEQSDKMKRVCSLLGNVPLMNALVFQDELDSRAKSCKGFEKTAVSMCLKWLGLPEDASLDDLFQASLGDWASQPTPQWTEIEYHGLLDLPLLPSFLFGDSSSTIELSEHPALTNDRLFGELTRHEEYFFE